MCFRGYLIFACFCWKLCSGVVIAHWPFFGEFGGLPPLAPPYLAPHQLLLPPLPPPLPLQPRVFAASDYMIHARPWVLRPWVCNNLFICLFVCLFVCLLCRRRTYFYEKKHTKKPKQNNTHPRNKNNKLKQNKQQQQTKTKTKIPPNRQQQTQKTKKTKQTNKKRLIY